MTFQLSCILRNLIACNTQTQKKLNCITKSSGCFDLFSYPLVSSFAVGSMFSPKTFHTTRFPARIWGTRKTINTTTSRTAKNQRTDNTHSNYTIWQGTRKWWILQGSVSCSTIKLIWTYRLVFRWETGNNILAQEEGFLKELGPDPDEEGGVLAAQVQQGRSRRRIFSNFNMVICRFLLIHCTRWSDYHS